MLELLIIVLGSMVATALFVRVLQVHFIRRKFREPFAGIPQEVRAQWAAERLWRFAGRNAVEGGTMVANTGQTLFHLSRIDSRVLEAIDRIHDPSTVTSYSQIVKGLGRLRREGKQAWAGSQSAYKGEFGEILMAEHLAIQGHVVEMAAPGTAGYDAHVDGQPVNFKVGLDRSHIEEHLRNYPNIPVITVSEQTQNFGEHPMVTCLDGISGEEIGEITSHTAESVLELGDFDSLPIITAVLSTARNFKPIVQGKSSDFVAALQYTAADVVGVGAGGFMGAKGGAAIGTFVLPVVGTAVGAFIGGVVGVVGVVGGRIAAGYFKEAGLREAMAALQKSLEDYGVAYVSGLEQKALTLEKSASTLTTARPWWRYIMPTPGDILRSDARLACKRWAAACRNLAKNLHRQYWNPDSQVPDFALLARDLASTPNEEPVFSREIMFCADAVKRCLSLVQLEQAKLGRTGR